MLTDGGGAADRISNMIATIKFWLCYAECLMEIIGSAGSQIPHNVSNLEQAEKSESI